MRAQASASATLQICSHTPTLCANVDVTRVAAHQQLLAHHDTLMYAGPRSMFLRARLPGALLALLLCIAAPLCCNADATLPATVVYNVPISAPGWKVKADSQENTRKRKSVASNVLDRDFDTIWHSRWSRNEAPLPHWIKIDMKTGRYNVTGLRCVPSIHIA